MPRSFYSLPRFSHDIEDLDELTDDLQRGAIADSVANLLRGPGNSTVRYPRVIGVYGSWGSGKSYLLSQITSLLLAGNDTDHLEGIIVCMFSPWRYEVEGDLAPGLISTLSDIERQLFRGRRENPPLRGKAYKAKARDLLNLLVGVIGIGLTLSPMGATAGTAVEKLLRRVLDQMNKDEVDRKGASSSQPDTDPQSESIADEITQIAQIRTRMQGLVDAILDAARAADDRLRAWRLVIIIDDLDRCSPENMVQMFEWLKVHLLVDRCTYVLALDHIAAARAITGQYKKYLSDDEGLAYGFRYLEKLVEVEYELDLAPNVEAMAMRQVSGDHKHRRLSEFARDVCGGDFYGIAFMNDLMNLRSLRVPRTALKMTYKFLSSLDIILREEGGRLRKQLPRSYPFWLLFLIAMYYRLDSDTLFDFVRGRGPVYHALRNPSLALDENGLKEPLREFCQFAQQVSTTAGTNMQIPSQQALRTLATIIRENTLAEID
ncbi:MAG TPA: P-loop NTPase fold protein [Ktedonobacterales bacterium]|nr:P-loop NTPase fold protein [Ktedonobacterales bacterium]